MICSGGCSTINLINNKMKKIDVIDINPEQLFLLELKIILLINYGDEKDKILNGEISDDEMINKYMNVRTQLSKMCLKYWNNKIELICEGIINIGKFDIFLEKLKKNKININNVLNNDIILIYGEKFINNQINKTFLLKLNEIIESNITIDHNYYNIENLKKNYHKINYITDNIIGYLLFCRKETYDYINLSDIVDNISEYLLKVLINELYRCLKNNGIVIMRRFNGIYEIKKYIDYNKFKLINDTKNEEIYEDKYGFCKELVILQKK